MSWSCHRCGRRDCWTGCSAKLATSWMSSRLSLKASVSRRKVLDVLDISKVVFLEFLWGLGISFFRKPQAMWLVLEAHEHVGGRAAPIHHGPFKGFQPGSSNSNSKEQWGMQKDLLFFSLCNGLLKRRCSVDPWRCALKQKFLGRENERKW